MRMSDNSAGSWNHVCQGFVAQPGQTYTISADFYIPNGLQGNGGAILGFGYNDTSGGWHHDLSQPIKSTNGWERHSFTFTFPTNTANNGNILAVITQSSAAGEFYFDNVQLEKSGGQRLYNLVENSDFSNAPGATSGPTGTNAYCWTKSGTEAADGVQVIGGRNYYCMSGSLQNAKKISQTVPVNAQAGDVLIIGGRAGAYATLDANNTRKFGIIAAIYDANGNQIDTNPDTSAIDPLTVDFDRSIGMEHQTKATSYVLTTACKYIVYQFVYYYHVDGVSFDDAFVYVGSFGERYTYDNKGQPTSTFNDDGELMEYTYSGAKVTDIDQTISGVKETVADIVYVPNTYNVQKITNNEGAKVEYAYTGSGQVASQTVTTADGEKIVESTTYYQNGNYPDTVTDTRGGTTKYTYDLNRGLLLSVKDPNNNVTTYTYDSNTDELLTTTGNANPSTPVTTSFGMQDHLLKTITRNGMTYTNDYDNQNRVTGLKVGSQTLVTNSYDSRRRLSLQSYANGATYAPVYDNRDRQTGEKWNGVQTIEHFYNENDRLSQTVDKVTGVTYKYDYAFFGLLNKVTGSDGTKTAYDYDMSGKLSSLTFSKNGATIHDARYYTDEKGNPEDVILKSLGNTALHYSYDGLGRLTGQSIGPLFTPIEYYAGATPGSTTNLVQSYKNEDGNETPLQDYTYTYDANGNIKTISDGVLLKASYDYDGLNRLIRENNAWMNKSYAYNYNAGGNLTTVTTHAYTTGTLGAATATENYAYGNANWKDQMTSHCGNAISYDALGNPVYFVGYTLTWNKGRQLTSFSGNGLNITYAYDASGHRIQQVANGTTYNYTYSGDLLMRQTDNTGKVLDFQYDAGGKMVGFMYNGSPYYYLRNLQNDVMAITDGDGNVVGSYAYDAWGNTTISDTIASVNPIRYRGYYQDPLTGWHYLNTRYYSSGLRRFLNADSMFIAGDDAINASNMYAYCNGNPVMFADPSGKLIIAALAALWAYGNYNLGQNSVIRTIVDVATIGINIVWEGIWNAGLKAKFGPDFAAISRDSDFGQKLFGGFLNWALNKGLYYADYVIAPIGNLLTGNCLLNKDWTKRVNDWGFGLQNLVWNFTMAPGARLGSWLLEFFPVSGGPLGLLPNYATREGQYQWQHFMGYNWYYDFFFSAGGPIKKLTYDFQATNAAGKTRDYIIWCWKADYWNLGPGAEIGIYYQDNLTRAARGFYDIDKDSLKVKTHMQVKYTGGKYSVNNPYVADIKQTNWWVTLFCPWVDQRIKNLDDLQIWQAVSIYSAAFNSNGTPYLDGNGVAYITDPAKHGYPPTTTPGKAGLFTQFQTSKWNNLAQYNIDDGKYLKWSPTAGQGWEYRDTNYAQYEFYIKF